MRIFKNQTKTVKVAEVLKERIRSRQFLPDTKLKSTRELAEEFDVSLKTITQAFDILESERLIRRELGRGVFISGRNKHSTREIALFCFQLSLDAPYLRNILKVLAMEPFRDGYSITIRTIPNCVFFQENSFRMELKRLVRHMNADCILIYASSLQEKSIQACLNEKTPVIFLGDFQAGDFDSINFSQIAEDNDYLGKSVVQKMYQKTSSKQLTFYGMEPELSSYMRRFAQGANLEAKRLGIELHWCCGIPAKSMIGTVQGKIDFCGTLVDRAIKNGWIHEPMFDLMNDTDSLRAFAERGIAKEIYSIKMSANSFPIYADTLNLQLENLLSELPQNRKIRLKLDYDLLVRKTIYS